MKKIIVLTSTLFLYSIISFAQKKHFCANAVYDSIALLTSPEFSIKKLRFEQAVDNHINSNLRNGRVAAEILRIPVVVHIIHGQIAGTIGGTNIPDEQIYSQIKVLNEDYRKIPGTMGFNTNPIGADTEIEFFLANLDPDGKPSSGITRSYSSKSGYNLLNDSERTQISSLSYWDSNKYLNIWVTSFRDPYIGYAEFPYAETIDGLNDEANENIDGVFIDYRVFGRKTGTNTKGLYSFGRTTTHEIGHWLGLIHIWGDERCGTDYVEDTPPATGSNSSAFCTAMFSTCAGVRTRNLIEDYMDYSPDSCMNIFTLGQKERMRAVIDLSKRRRRIVNFAKFQLPPSTTLQATIFPNPTTAQNIQVQVLLPNFQDFSIALTDILGRNVYAESFTDLPSTIVTLKTKDLPPGTYILSVNSSIGQVKKRLAVN